MAKQEEYYWQQVNDYYNYCSQMSQDYNEYEFLSENWKY